MTASPTPQSLRVQLPATGTALTYGGTPFDVCMVQHEAYIFEGRYFRTAALFSDEGDNVTISSGDGTWPQPGAWFDHMAAEIAATATGAVAS